MGKGGGGEAPTEQTSNTNSLPDYAEPYYKDLMERAQALTNEDYIPYQDPRIAEQSPYTQGSYDAVGAVTGSSLPYTQEAMNSTGLIGSNVLNNMPGVNPDYISGMIPGVTGVSSGYPGDVNYGGGMTAPGNVQYQQNAPWFGIGSLPGVNYSDIDPNNLQQANGMMIEAERFPQAQLDEYMNPYTESVVQDTNDELWRQNLQEQANIRNRMADSGAYGGSRQGLLESEQDRNYLSQAARTANQQFDQSFQHAQNQINSDQNRVLQGDMANQSTNLQAQFANQEQGIRSALANQQTGLSAGSLDAQLGLNRRLANQQTGLQAGMADQGASLQAGMSNQQSQFQTGAANLDAAMGAGLANQQWAGQGGLADQDAYMQAQLANQGSMLQGLTSDQQAQLQGQMSNQNSFLDQNKTALGAAEQLGGLSNLYQDMGLTGATAMGSVGADQELYRQALYDTAYQDFMNQNAYPYQQLQRYNSYLQGVPINMNSEVTGGTYQNPYSQLLGLGIGGLGTYQALEGLG